MRGGRGLDCLPTLPIRNADQQKEQKQKGAAPAMIVFCAFQQMQTVIDYGKKHGFKNNYPLVFVKKSSSQVLKANMKIVGATEYAVVLYRDKLPKFNNGRKYNDDGSVIRGSGKMVKNWFEWAADNKKDHHSFAYYVLYSGGR